MPARFIKKLWVRRGGYLMVEDSQEADGEAKITASIVAVLYEEHIKEMKKIPGAWYCPRSCPACCPGHCWVSRSVSCAVTCRVNCRCSSPVTCPAGAGWCRHALCRHHCHRGGTQPYMLFCCHAVWPLLPGEW
jgi:hypothetical protein